VFVVDETSNSSDDVVTNVEMRRRIKNFVHCDISIAHSLKQIPEISGEDSGVSQMQQFNYRVELLGAEKRDGFKFVHINRGTQNNG
jgi:hypothetical protein